MADVLLVEDHAAVREGLALLLSRAGQVVVGSTGEVGHGLALAAARKPRVIVLDLDLGDEHGLAWLDRLQAAAPEARILIYTAAEEPGVLEAALAGGAAGVALKACSGAELVEAVRAVADGRRYLDPRLTEILRESVGNDLSPREKQVLELLAAGLTGEQVADRLFLSPETVRTHVRNAMRKLGAPTRARAVVLALTTGRIAAAQRESA
jgi:DNA-binding NarL/FixJ family response regulator